MSGTPTLSCFLLSREWRDTSYGVEIVLWGLTDSLSSEDHLKKHAVKVIVRAESVMFIPRRTPNALLEALEHPPRREPVQLQSLQGEDVDALYFKQQRDLVHARDVLRQSLHVGLESDVKPSDRYLMERFITGAFEVHGAFVDEHRGVGNGVLVMKDARVRGIERSSKEAVPLLTTTSIDIETDGIGGPLLSVALVTRGSLVGEGIHRERVILIGEAPRTSGLGEELMFVPDERALLEAFFDSIAAIDPDVIIGWNVVEFDLTVIEKRCAVHGLSFALGRGRDRARVIPGDRGQVSIVRVPGRIVLDGIATLKNATWAFERFSLDFVAQELLGRRKQIDASKHDKVAEIRRMAKEDPLALAAYNLEDARLVSDIFEKALLLDFAFARAELVGLPLDRQGGSVAAFDHLYLPRLHRAGFVAGDVGVDIDGSPSPGGEVLESVPGLHDHVLSFDFRSLYPSIIRTFLIDPLGLQRALHSDKEFGENELVQGFDGARFVRSPSILPGLIARLTIARKEAQGEGNEALSRAIKIQMNSFYGVLGTPGCRFFDPRLASSITRRGHEVIHRAKRFFEARGYRVLYGDTDSVFVHVASALKGLSGQALLDEGARLGTTLALEATRELALEIEAKHHLESALELRFESHYTRFLMPTMRGTEVGSKKRYAGAVVKKGQTEIVVRGLEAVRTDWTPLARRVQRELFRRVFANEEWKSWLRALREDLFHGKLDDELVYRKRLRRELDAYGAAPPHVRAARMLQDEPGDLARHEVEYVMTVHGPEPIELLKSAIDYGHYAEKQLAPACDVVLHVLGESFGHVAGTQLSLF